MHNVPYMLSLASWIGRSFKFTNHGFGRCELVSLVTLISPSSYEYLWSRMVAKIFFNVFSRKFRFRRFTCPCLFNIVVSSKCVKFLLVFLLQILVNCIKSPAVVLFQHDARGRAGDYIRFVYFLLILKQVGIVWNLCCYLTVNLDGIFVCLTV